MLTEVHGKHSYKIFFYLEIVNFAICHSLLLQAIPTFYWKFLEWFHFQINTQGGDRLLDSTVHINHYLKRVRLRLFIYMSMNQTAYLNNFCSLQQSSLLPSGPHSQTLSTCGAYHHPEHQGSGYRFQAWCSSSWNQQRTSYTIWGGKTFAETSLVFILLILFVQNSKQNCRFTHQNSPSSAICWCNFSFSSLEMVDHSFELHKAARDYNVSNTATAQLRMITCENSFQKVTYLSLHGPFHSTWPHGLRRRTRRTLDSFCALCLH